MMALGTLVHGGHYASTSRMSLCWVLYPAFRSSGSSEPSREHSILWDTEISLVLMASGILGSAVSPCFGPRGFGNPGPSCKWETLTGDNQKLTVA